MNLFLIGYRCSGKTTVGKSIAKKLGWAFVDADAMLVAASGKNIKDIIDIDGWASFRRMEHITLTQICAKKRQVVATGGGVVLDAANIAAMKSSGQVIWLNATADTIRSRMQADANTEHLRPALTDRGALAEIENLLTERRPLYERASDVLVHTDGIPVAEIAKRILDKLNEGNADKR
ncbi:MAG: shikimate kinase [Desulfobacterales bacterium]|nr:shikimate kinase [Desulfobacterales bacterium]